jgi:protein-S-isoprenylcysteine O-methyltransferase Ste14
MTAWGVGPKFAIISGAMGLVFIVTNRYYFPNLSLSYNPVSFWFGIVVILIGIGIFFKAAVQVHRGFDLGRLVTDGVYAYVRHLVYAVWILFIAPGLFLTTGAFFLIALPFLMYAVFRTLIVEEDEYLKQRFGQEFTDYEKKVNSIIPKLR